MPRVQAALFRTGQFSAARLPLAAPGAAVPEGLPGDVPRTAHFNQVVGLVWRSVALWLLLLALLSLAHVLG